MTAYNSQHTAHTGRGRDRYCDGLQQSAYGASGRGRDRYCDGLQHSAATRRERSRSDSAVSSRVLSCHDSPDVGSAVST